MQRGILFDLGPDGLGFISSSGKTFALVIEDLNTGFDSFEKAGLRNGMRVEFETSKILFAGKEVERITFVKPAKK